MIASKSLLRILIAEDLCTKRRSIRSQEGPQHKVQHVLQIPHQEPMAQASPCPILGLPTQLHARFHIHLHLATCLSRIRSVSKPHFFFFFFPATPGHPIELHSANVVILIISAVCTILAVVEIILFAATRLDPLTNLILQLAKTITWFVLFVLAAVATTPVQNEMETEDKQGYSLGSRSEYFYLQWFAEPLVLL